MAAPDDTSQIAQAIDDGRIEPRAICAVFAKTEGNGCVNDFTRAFAAQSLRLLLAKHLDPASIAQIAMVMSGGTEGALSPHFIVLEALTQTSVPGDGAALAVGVHRTPDHAPEDIGSLAQVQAVADGVRAAMVEAAIETPGAVRFVQVKCPLLTAQRVGEAANRGVAVRTADTLKSMGLSRGAAALGIAVALGEIAPGTISEQSIGRDNKLYSRVASCSAGIELMGNEIVVLGQSAAWTGPLTIHGSVMEDAVDLDGVHQMLGRLGVLKDGRVPVGRRNDVLAVLAKAEPSSSGRVRGNRHTMLDDSDIAATRHARGFVGGVLAGVIGHTELYVSGGAEHQGPDGGGPVAAIVRRLL